jgi:hypothetical protein
LKRASYSRSDQALTILLSCAVALLILTIPGSLYAQGTPPALVVELRAWDGSAIGGVDVLLTDRSGTTLLGRALTNSSGVAQFGPLPTNELRVLLRGQLADGTALLQPGLDAQGIAMFLAEPAMTLVLRSERDGMVRPDPVGEVLRDQGGGRAATVAAIPTALPAIATLVPPGVTPEPTPLAPATSGAMKIWLGLLLLGMLGVLLLFVIIQLRWWRSPC